MTATSSSQNHQPYGSAPQWTPRPQVGFLQAIRNNFKYLFHFSGRASRTEFWYAYLTWFILLLVAVGVFIFALVLLSAAQAGQAGGTIEDPSLAVALVLLSYLLMAFLMFLFSVGTLSLTWRRLQDAGFHGAFAILQFASLGIIPLVMCALPSAPEGARFDGPKDLDRP